MSTDIRMSTREWSANMWSRIKALISNINTTIGSLTAADVGAVPTSEKGAASGVAELDSGGKVPSSQLPSYVDDVLEYSSLSVFPETGESGKIYIALNTNVTYRWGGSSYVAIGSSLALGETSSTAYRGDRGKIAYDHAQAKGSAFASGLYKVTTNGEGHVTGATAVQKSDITDLGIPGEAATVENITNQEIDDIVQLPATNGLFEFRTSAAQEQITTVTGTASWSTSTLAWSATVAEVT